MQILAKSAYLLLSLLSATWEYKSNCFYLFAKWSPYLLKMRRCIPRAKYDVRNINVNMD